MKRILMSIMILLALGMMMAACQKKDKPTTGGGGGDNSVTISGTVNVEGVTLTIYNDMSRSKILFGPTVIGTSYSVKFVISERVPTAFMLFSKSGCGDDAKSIDISPGSNINVGGASLTCS